MPETKQRLEEIIKELENIGRQINNISLEEATRIQTEESGGSLYESALAKASIYLTMAIQYLKLAKDYKK